MDTQRPKSPLPWEAKEAGARIVATGRSDFANQVNNSLCFPGVFRGALDVQANRISDEMAIAVADEICAISIESGLKEDRIVPRMDEWEIYPRIAAATALKAQEQAIAKTNFSRLELIEIATEKIRQARAAIQSIEISDQGCK